MANKRQIKHTLNQYFSIKDIQDVAKFWDVDNPEDTSSFDVVMEELQKAMNKVQAMKDKKLAKFKELHCNQETFKGNIFLNIEEEYTRCGEVVNRR